MVKTLIPVSVQLESSIALRYARELARWIDLRVQEIHIIEAGGTATPAAQGWVRDKWENATIEAAGKEIHQFLSLENLDLKRLRSPEILIGNRTEKLLEKLMAGEYHLFLEGALPTFDPSDFHSLLCSALYSTMPRPALVVKNLVALNSVAMLVDAENCRTLVSSFLRIFGASGIGLDLVSFAPAGKEISDIRESEANADWLEETAEMFKNSGISLENRTVLEGTIPGIAEHLRQYGLVVASVDRKPDSRDPKMEILARASIPVLICWSNTSF